MCAEYNIGARMCNISYMRHFWGNKSKWTTAQTSRAAAAPEHLALHTQVESALTGVKLHFHMLPMLWAPQLLQPNELFCGC